MANKPSSAFDTVVLDMVHPDMAPGQYWLDLKYGVYQVLEVDRHDNRDTPHGYVYVRWIEGWSLDLSNKFGLEHTVGDRLATRLEVAEAVLSDEACFTRKFGRDE
jgi:hypothetical protein